MKREVALGERCKPLAWVDVARTLFTSVEIEIAESEYKGMAIDDVLRLLKTSPVEDVKLPARTIYELGIIEGMCQLLEVRKEDLLRPLSADSPPMPCSPPLSVPPLVKDTENDQAEFPEFLVRFLGEEVLMMREAVLRLGGPEDPIKAFYAHDRPDIEQHHEWNYCYGMVTGVVRALNVSYDDVFEAIDDYLWSSFSDELVASINRTRADHGCVPLPIPYGGPTRPRRSGHPQGVASSVAETGGEVDR